ncbi:MAG: hypothetical protein QOC99_3879 [Acidobacteriota bacterium]|jgi:hypothetical protein|nr:hypothetical protein [Acidobacteriota bacterium]
MYNNVRLRRFISLSLSALLLAGHLLLAPATHGGTPLPGNGIFVGQTKLYDERSLALMLQSLEARLANRDFFDQGSVAAAIGKFQGARLDASSFGVNLTTTPIPGVSTEMNTGGSTELNQKVTQAAVAAGVTPGLPGIETTNNAKTNNSFKEDVTQPAVNPAAAPLPSQTSAFSFQPPFGLAPQMLLAQQIELTHALDNVRLMLEGSLTDRIITVGTPAGAFTGARSRAVVGFEINLDSPKRYENAVAEVEITVTTQQPSAPAGMAPSVVSVLPRENDYNVATVTKNARQFGFGVAVQPINLGLSTQMQKETLFLVQDLDTVSFQRSQPWNAAAPAGSVTFGWQFRPVLGQKTIKAGPRQVFATLALPATDLNDFAGKVEARTFWRKYDPKNKTVGDYINGSDTYQQLNNLNVPGVLAMASEPLQPQAVSLDWMDAGQGNILVTSRGQHYLPGMGIILGNQVIDNAEKGLFLQSDKSFRWLVPGHQIALVEDALLAGRFGPPARLRDPLAPANTGAHNLTIMQVATSPLDAQNSTVRVGLHCTAAADFNPVIILGDKAYGFSDAPLVKVASVPAAVGGRNMVLEFVAPTQTLREATKLTARLLFFGRDYTDELLATNFMPPAGSAFMTSKVVVLTAGATNLFAITGSGFNPATVKVTVDGITLSPGAAAGVPGAAGANRAVLTFNDPTLLTLSIPAALAKTVKQITLVQGGAPILLPVTAQAPPPPKPIITDIEPVNVGDQAYVKVTGNNLGSVDKALFQGTVLKTKDISDDGKMMELLVTKDMTAAKGRRSIDFVSKDGTTEVTGDLIVKP